MSARSNLSGDQVSGTNSGSITLAMNSTGISGTPRTNSMNTMEDSRTAGSPGKRRRRDLQGSRIREKKEVAAGLGIRRVEPGHPATADREQNEESVAPPA